MLSMTLNDVVPGTYPVVTILDSASTRPDSSVLLELRRRGQKLQGRRAVGGSVTITQLSSNVNAPNASKLIGKADLEFAIPNTESGACTSTMVPGGNNAGWECECTSESGDAFTCNGTEPDCCFTQGTGRQTVSFQLEAQPCAAL